MSENIVIALIAFAGTLLGSYFAQRKTTALVVYRLEQLENKVDKHNSVIERMYKVEQKVCLIDEKIKVANHRIDDLEKYTVRGFQLATAPQELTATDRGKLFFIEGGTETADEVHVCIKEADGNLALKKVAFDIS